MKYGWQVHLGTGAKVMRPYNIDDVILPNLILEHKFIHVKQKGFEFSNL